MMSLIEKLGLKKLLSFIGLVVLFLLALAFFLGINSLRNTQQIVTEDFQQQQLILARATARQIEDSLAFLRRELKVLAYSPSIQYLEEVAWANRMRVSFEELSRLGVTAIIRIDFAEGRAGKAYVFDATGPHIIKQDFMDTPEVKWALDPQNRHQVYQGPIQVERQGQRKIPYLIMATPIYEESVDESHPKPTNKFDGVLLFRIDVSQFTEHYCGGIRSGRTGYTWVIDKEGLFLFHPEKEFIGEDAFTARGRRNPVIKFEQINEIQKTRMLAGEEGTASYISGWHGGLIGEMKKLLGFSQIYVDPDCQHVRTAGAAASEQDKARCQRIWSVAVVAPIDEVSGIIHSLYIRQFFIQGILIFALLVLAVGIVYYEMRWSRELQQAVDRTTLDLQRSREQYRSVVENARDFIFSVDIGGKIMAANNATARALGLPAKGLKGRDIQTFFSPQSKELFMDYIRDTFEQSRTFEARPQMTINDRVYWLSIHFIPLMGEDGRTVERVLVMARDITERKQMEDQMAQTEKLASLGTLSAGVAHEFNNPLGIMLGFTEILLDRIPAGTKEHELLETIERQGLNAKKIVENLMSFSRTPSRHDEFTDVNEDLANILQVVQNTLFTKRIEVETKFAKDLPQVRGDASELQQVFLNIINNAAGAMPGGGRLTVMTKINPYSNMVEVIFADTGTGIPKEVADQIFDPFFTTKEVGKNTGLGLSVSYGIVRTHGGYIDVESAVGVGTTVRVDLPVNGG